MISGMAGLILIGSMLTACRSPGPEVVGNASPCLTEPWDGEKDLTVVLCPTTSMMPRDSVLIFVGLRNDGEAPIKIRRLLAVGEDLTVSVRTENGRELTPTGIQRMVHLPPRITDVVLRPGEVLGRTLNLACPEDDVAAERCGLYFEFLPGGHEIVVDYVFECATGTCTADDPWAGRTTSRPMAIFVGPSTGAR